MCFITTRGVIDKTKEGPRFEVQREVFDGVRWCSMGFSGEDGLTHLLVNDPNIPSKQWGGAPWLPDHFADRLRWRTHGIWFVIWQYIEQQPDTTEAPNRTAWPSARLAPPSSQGWGLPRNRSRHVFDAIDQYSNL